MKVRDVMTTKALFETHEADTLASAAHRMVWAGCRHLPVTKDHEVVGVLSERDILAWRAEGRGLDGPGDLVAAAMSAPPILAVPDENLSEAAARMIASRVDCLPVVMTGRLVGMLTSTDLLGRVVTQPFEAAGRGDVAAGTVMTTRVLVAHASDLLREAADVMIANHVRHLPVVDEEGHLIGILSERDLRTALGHPGTPTGADTVREFITAPAISIRAELLVSRVIATMFECGVGALPVVDRENRPIGIVSYLDAVRAARLERKP